MKRIEKASELLWLLGTIFVALGVSICSKTGLGVSMIAAPAFVVAEAVAPICQFFSVGVTEYIIQGILLVLLCLIIKRFNWRFLLTFAVAVIYGYTLDLFLWILKDVAFEGVVLRWVMLIVGDIFTAFGVACFFRTNLPLQVYEMFVKEVSSTFKISINKTKWGFDISLLTITIILVLTLFGDLKEFDWSTVYYTSFHSIGLGTIVTTIINSPIIKAWGKVIDRVFGSESKFPKINRVLKVD